MSTLSRLRQALDPLNRDSGLLGLLAFMRTAHYWTETHPDLPLEPGAIAFLDQHPQLARLLTDPADAAAASLRAAWPAAADQLLEQARALTRPPPPDALPPGQHRTSRPAVLSTAITADRVRQ